MSSTRSSELRFKFVSRFASDGTSPPVAELRERDSTVATRFAKIVPWFCVAALAMVACEADTLANQVPPLDSADPCLVLRAFLAASAITWVRGFPVDVRGKSISGHTSHCRRGWCSVE